MSVERSAPRGAVFLSYASQDAEAARRICDTLRAAGVEVWLDQSELVGGDTWDRKIRDQINNCALFVPVISASTQARREGYFRLEWKLAAQRTHMMSERTAFLLPVVIDATRDADADVPSEFRAVQWTRLPLRPIRQAHGGHAQDADSSAGKDSVPSLFVERVKCLLGGDPVPAATRRVESVPGSVVTNSKARATRTGVRTWMTLAAVIVIGVSVIFFATRTRDVAPNAKLSPVVLRSDGERGNSLPPESTDAKSIAVLPFANLPEDKNTEYFSDGLTEEILNALAADPTLRVAARTSAFAFKGKSTSIEDIGRALKVARIIEGSVRKDGSKVRITVKLVSAANGYQEWSQQFNAEMTDIFALQSEVAGKIAQRLGGTIMATAPGKSAPVPTTSLAAYDLYLRARALTMAPQSTSVRLEAVKLYEDAVKLDPGYALAWARLAQLLTQIITGGFDRSASLATRAATAAGRALQLAPQLPEAHLAIASVRFELDADHEAAQRALDEVVRLAPNHPEAYLALTNLERERGNWGESLVRLSSRAVELDPQNAASLQRLGSLLNSTGQFAEADRLLVRSWEISQTAGQTLRRRATNRVAWTGEVDAALAIMNSTPPDLKKGVLFPRARAELHAMRGDLVAALADLKEAKQAGAGMNTSGPRGVSVECSYRMVRIESLRGRAAEAGVHLEDALTLARAYVADFPELPDGWGNLALAEAMRGDKAAALGTLEEALRRATRTRDAFQIARMRVTRAEMLTIFDDKAAAIAELRAVHDMGYGFGYTLRRELEWVSLKSEPAFQRLMAEAEARAKAQPQPEQPR